jgi:alpha-glucosidase
MQDTILSWNDLPHPGCPRITVIIDSLPPDTPENATFFFAANFNNWDPGSRYWMFTRGLDGKYFIEIPRNNDGEIEYKVTRGGWWTVECATSGEDIDNRIYNGKAGKEVKIIIERWKDR